MMLGGALTELEIRPFVGVGPINFGMAPADVERLLGSPSRIDPVYKSSSTRAAYPEFGMYVHFDGEARCYCVAAGGIGQPSAPTFDGVRLEGPLTVVIDRLLRKDFFVRQGGICDFFIFDSLGLYLLATDEDDGVEPWVDAVVSFSQRKMLEEFRS